MEVTNEQRVTARVVWCLENGHKVHARIVRRHAEALGVQVPDDVENLLAYLACACRDCNSRVMDWRECYGVLH